MSTLRFGQLLNIWEEGARASSTQRALLLLSASHNESVETLLNLSVGARDARLIGLYEQLFGGQVQALATCGRCREQLELAFPLSSIRADFDVAAGSHDLICDDYSLTFRSANSADLLLAEREPTVDAAERALIARCVLAAHRASEQVAPADLPQRVVDSLSLRMGELDAQAEVVFDAPCAACGSSQHLWFDIVTHLWSALERAARTVLRDVHELATAYGWSEPQILRLSPARRRAYLSMLGTAVSRQEAVWQA